MIIDAAFVPKLARKVRLKFDRHERKHMLIYPERGLVLNDSAAAIAGKCDGTRSIARIAEELAAEHGDEAAAIQRDVVAFVQDLFDKNLLDTHAP